MESILVQPGEGERITGDSELGVTLLADFEQIGVADIRSKPGGENPPLHAHARHAECFFVLEGELTFRFEDRELSAGPETWVFVPPEVLHSFGVTGDGRAHFLDIHVPSNGFGDFVRGLHSARNGDELREVRAAFDQHQPPEYSSADPSSVLQRTSARGETIADQPERRVILLVDTEELATTETIYGPEKLGPELHVHHDHVDGFVVVEGELTIAFREGSLRAPSGTLVIVPPDVVHTFRNDGTETARFFNLHAPSCGFGDYLRGRKPDFDQHDPPADGGRDPASVIATRLSGDD
ncbi:MAG: cupin domain-containing protein [Actinomycetota bacterium]|nr:cupin domain-containing protein [Actinomycetota bacterium]